MAAAAIIAEGVPPEPQLQPEPGSTNEGEAEPEPQPEPESAGAPRCEPEPEPSELERVDDDASSMSERAEPEPEPEHEPTESAPGWNPSAAVPAGFFRFRSAWRRDGGTAAAVPGDLRVGADGVLFTALSSLALSIAAEQEAEEGTLWGYETITSWKTTQTGADGALLDLNIQEQHYVFEMERGDTAAITRAILGFIEALVAERQRARDAVTANRERVAAWLDMETAAESPLRRVRTDSGGNDSAWSAPQHLRKRPMAVALPDDVGGIRRPVVVVNSSSGSDSSPQLAGILTPERELSVAMRAAAIATEQHSPRTAALKLSSFEQDLRHKAPASSRMAQVARMQDEDIVVSRARRVAEIATSAQATNLTPSRIQARLQMNTWQDGIADRAAAEAPGGDGLVTVSPLRKLGLLGK